MASFFFGPSAHRARTSLYFRFGHSAALPLSSFSAGRTLA